MRKVEDLWRCPRKNFMLQQFNSAFVSRQHICRSSGALRRVGVRSVLKSSGDEIFHEFFMKLSSLSGWGSAGVLGEKTNCGAKS